MTVRCVHTYCAMCVSRRGVVATVEDGLFSKVNADPEHPNGCICVKGSAAPEIVYSPDRLRYPMVRTRPKGDGDPGWARTSWDDALALAASRLLDIKARHGPEAVVFSRATPAGGATGDFESWVQRVANAFGSPNVLTTTHICTWNRRWGAKYTYGVVTPSPDYEHTRCILLWGELDRPGYDAFGPDGANVNLLIANEAVDPISGSVPHRSQMCRVRKVDAAG